MRGLAIVLVALTVSAPCLAAASPAERSPIRVSLTAQNHDPRASKSPSVHWWYCVKVTTAAGKSVPSTIRLQFAWGRKSVLRFAVISLRKGYDHWRAGLGGEASVLNGVPRGKKLLFQAVVTAQGVTVTRSWPIVVR